MTSVEDYKTKADETKEMPENLNATCPNSCGFGLRRVILGLLGIVVGCVVVVCVFGIRDALVDEWVAFTTKPDPIALQLFEAHEAAWRSGLRLIRALERSTINDRRKLSHFNDQLVVLRGGSCEGKLRFLLDCGYTVNIVVPTGEDVVPRALAWEAYILGRIKEIDFEQKTIECEVAAKDFKVILAL
jgi:hypothetical protein